MHLPWINEQPKGRLLELDILRGVAVLMVIGSHSAVNPGPATGLAHALGVWLVRFGGTGVDLFFVLSGYLVGGLLLEELATTGRLHVGRFLIRRGFKIWPGYIALVLFLLVGHLAKYQFDLGYTWHVLWPNFFHVQNYFHSPREHTWSLAVEEHFYLVLPLLLGLLPCRREERGYSIPLFPWMALLIAVGCFTLRLVCNAHGDFDYYSHIYRTHLRVDSLFFGVFLSYLAVRFRSGIPGVARFRGWLLLAGVALFIPFRDVQVDKEPWVLTYGFTMLYLGYGMILLGLVSPAAPGDWLKRVLYSLPGRITGFIGYFSYAIYLWHMDFGHKPVDLLNRAGYLDFMGPSLRWVVGLAVMTGLALVVGVALGKFIEYPALAIRDRLFPRTGANPHIRNQTG